MHAKHTTRDDRREEGEEEEKGRSWKRGEGGIHETGSWHPSVFCRKEK